MERFLIGFGKFAIWMIVWSIGIIAAQQFPIPSSYVLTFMLCLFIKDYLDKKVPNKKELK